MDPITGGDVLRWMNQRRKFLRLVDLRVRHHLAGQITPSSDGLARLHSLESLTSARTDLKALGQAEKMEKNPSI